MEKSHPAIEYAKHDLETFQNRLRDLEADRLKIGTSINGISWQDTTSEEINFARAKIVELTALLSTSSA